MKLSTRFFHHISYCKIIKMARDDYMFVVLKPVNGNLVIEYACRYSLFTIGRRSCIVHYYYQITAMLQ